MAAIESSWERKHTAPIRKDSDNQVKQNRLGSVEEVLLEDKALVAGPEATNSGSRQISTGILGPFDDRQGQ